MLPKVITHNQISLDGSVTGFGMNLNTYYSLAGKFEAQGYLVGSETARKGIETFTFEVPSETEDDFEKKPALDNENRPYWIIVDSTGKLEDMLHVYRRFELVREVIVLISNATPNSYMDYLLDRKYDFFISGEEKIDLKESLEWVEEKYGVQTIMTDSGGVLNTALMEKKLVNEVSLILSPLVVNQVHPRLFRNAKFADGYQQLSLKSHKVLQNDLIHMIYNVVENRAKRGDDDW